MTDQPKSYSGRKEKRLQDQRWYYGLCSRDMVTPLLKHKGDYLVRAWQKGEVYIFVLNVKNERGVDNLQIVLGPNNDYYLRALESDQSKPTFPSIIHLIKHYKRHPLPNKLRLQKAINRPNWLVAPQKVRYKKENKMGSGNFSEVYKGYFEMPVKKKKVECAIKILHFHSQDHEDNSRIRFLAEAKMHGTYVHDNIVRWLGVVLDCPPIMMLMELCRGGSLESHLKKRGTTISSYEKMVYLLEASRGMRYLHTQNCIHRDLAARNCLISSDGIVKISDFGLSLFTNDGGSMNDQMEQVPLRWMAPECLQRKQSFSFSTDVWAYGVLIFEVFTNGLQPYHDYTDETGPKSELKMIQLIRKADMPPPPTDTPTAVAGVLSDIWQKNPEVRPTFNTIVHRLCEELKNDSKNEIEPSKFVVNEIDAHVKRTIPPNLDPAVEPVKDKEKDLETSNSHSTRKKPSARNQVTETKRPDSPVKNDLPEEPTQLLETQKTKKKKPKRKLSTEMSGMIPVNKLSVESVSFIRHSKEITNGEDKKRDSELKKRKPLKSEIRASRHDGDPEMRSRFSRKGSDEPTQKKQPA